MHPKVQELIRSKEVDAILFFSPENLRYLTGYSGGEGALYVEEDRAFLLVDFRYLEEAQGEAKDCEVLLLKGGMKGLKDFLLRRGRKRIALEGRAITLAGFRELLDTDIQFLSFAQELDPLRAVKTPWEVEHIREAVRVAEEAFSEVLELVRPGVSEGDIALELEYKLRKKGSEGVPFPIIVLSGPRTSLPHGIPTKRLLEEGEPVLFDFGARIAGYCSDETRTLFLGDPPEELKKIHRIVLEAHDRALEAVRPNVPFREVDAIARRVIEEAGYGDYFGHSTGHGVGLAVHEFPSLSPEAEGTLEEGMVVTVEPGIYIPGLGGVRIEDLCLVTRDGPEVLTTLKRDPKTL